MRTLNAGEAPKGFEQIDSRKFKLSNLNFSALTSEALQLREKVGKQLARNPTCIGHKAT